MKQPLVTVVTATHNRNEAVLERSLPSILEQTHENLEIIVVSDGPDEGLKESLAHLNDPRVKYLDIPRPEYPQGVMGYHIMGAAAVNAGLEEAQGEFIAHLDDDDEFLPDHIQKSVERHNLVQCDVTYGKAMREIHPDQWVVYGVPFAKDYLMAHNITVHSTVVFRAKHRYKFQYNEKPSMQPADWMLWKDMARAGLKFEFINHILARYHWHGNRKRLHETD